MDIRRAIFPIVDRVLKFSKWYSQGDNKTITCGVSYVGHVNAQSCHLSLFSLINHSARSTLDWELNSLSYFDWMFYNYKHHQEFPIHKKIIPMIRCLRLFIGDARSYQRGDTASWPWGLWHVCACYYESWYWRWMYTGWVLRKIYQFLRFLWPLNLNNEAV